tara:strand:- start:1583 stop:2035 length:453 start_codon:yes stop_codon:yes gene_type:complete
MGTNMFAQHGKFQMAYEQNIIIIIAEGEWNFEASLNATTKIQYMVDHLQHKQHAFIFDTKKLQGLTPEAYGTWSKAVDYWLAHGFKALARVADPSKTHYKMFIEPFDAKLKDLMPINFNDTLEEAVSGLHDLGFYGFEQGIDLNQFMTNK